jgi:hypothetical protein
MSRKRSCASDRWFSVHGLRFRAGRDGALDAKVDKPDPTASEYGWAARPAPRSGLPRSELVVIGLQQLQPANVELQLALKPIIYAAIEK